eukprot:TRINITY_DN6614_c0_g1_i1.p1 TRINITY_DN6614_c0_g1~~TRINITY_DN6614_c0_g1_i1.p1  ORF type:complete len:513 (+),score=170.91 TRINITY_DN6614_c0_g1_i1:97-1635(+)
MEHDLEESGSLMGRVSAREKVVWWGVVVVTFVSVVGLVGLCVALIVSEDAQSDDSDEPSDLSNLSVIMMISDGFGPSGETFGRLMSGNQPLELDSWFLGRSRTFSSSSDITDSAAGATAYSCALHSYNGAIAVTDTTPPKACGTVMEAAKREGMVTAAVVTSRITHATPASYMSHMSHRDYEEEIAEQIARNQSVDLLFGGGRAKFSPAYGRRKDDADLLEEMRERGYQVITTKQEMDEDKLSFPLFGCFADSHMSYEIDRVRSDPVDQPSLEQMVRKALAMLEAKGKRFFLLIEGSRIDMAAHDHDAGAQYREIMQYQAAAKVVRGYVEENPNTLVLSTSDHSTGGISVGALMTPLVYPNYTWSPEVLHAATGSAEHIEQQVTSPADIPAMFEQYTGIVPTEDEVNFITAGYEADSRFFRTRMGDVAAHRAGVGFTTPGHTGVDVGIYGYGNVPPEIGGVMENIHVGKAIIDYLGFHEAMQEISEELSDMTFPPKSGPKEDKKRQVYDGHS